METPAAAAETVAQPEPPKDPREGATHGFSEAELEIYGLRSARARALLAQAEQLVVQANEAQDLAFARALRHAYRRLGIDEGYSASPNFEKEVLKGFTVGPRRAEPPKKG